MVNANCKIKTFDPIKLKFKLLQNLINCQTEKIL